LHRNLYDFFKAVYKLKTSENFSYTQDAGLWHLMKKINTIAYETNGRFARRRLAGTPQYCSTTQPENEKISVRWRVSRQIFVIKNAC